MELANVSSLIEILKTAPTTRTHNKVKMENFKLPTNNVDVPSTSE